MHLDKEINTLGPGLAVPYLEYDDGIAMCRGSENHLRDESRSSKGGVSGTLVDMFLWCCGFLKPNQWSQDTAADAKWTNADYQL